MLVEAEKVTDTVERMMQDITESSEDAVAEITDVMVIVHVNYGVVNEDGSESGSLFYRCSSAKSHVQRGLLADVDNVITRSRGE